MVELLKEAERRRLQQEGAYPQGQVDTNRDTRRSELAPAFHNLCGSGDRQVPGEDEGANAVPGHDDIRGQEVWGVWLALVRYCLQAADRVF